MARLDSGAKRSTIPVAIVGGGPVGLVLALFLDRYGVRSALFNSEENQRAHPKGSSQNARTLEHFRRLGISEPVRRLGLPVDHPTDVAYFTRFNAWELARIRMPSEAEKMRAVAAARATDQIPEPILRANQMYVEAFLLDHARTFRSRKGAFDILRPYVFDFIEAELSVCRGTANGH